MVSGIPNLAKVVLTAVEVTVVVWKTLIHFVCASISTRYIFPAMGPVS